ncbi:MAG: nucleotidyl transferase AbiEii/AbiGii toxin family protein [Ignavibacteriae bacterium]|nr:nucleotidyl transferase AbiEii/AbiGii toxin family protein [Ignavibacteriota bacterium]NOH00200.1 nucleotidyl transferase AbiEii/AbiGii toxin family protein [Ignavibacteriota bacterium]
MDNIYSKQVELLLRVLPIINKDKDFALKGGTAINFFVRDMPRLSVDIDLVYLPIKDRYETLNGITEKLKHIGESVRHKIITTNITEQKLKGTEYLGGLLIKNNDAVIKIEANTVIRGSVYKPKIFSLCEKAQSKFEVFFKTRCLSIADLYGGKICAALDRQHPRDLYDVKLLLDNEGFSEEIRKAFLVYLISHDRPIVELLNPNQKDIGPIYEQEFEGMTDEKIDLKELNITFDILVKTVNKSLTSLEKEFLLSFKQMRPDWALLNLENIGQMPSVKWKLKNLERMDKEKCETAIQKLAEHLSNI